MEGGLARASDGLETLLVSTLLPYTPSNQICCDLLLGRIKEKQKSPPLEERKSLRYSRLTVLNLCVGHSSFGVRILVMLHIKCLQFMRVAELQLQSSGKLILWLQVTTTWGTELQGRSMTKAENHCSGLMDTLQQCLPQVGLACVNLRVSSRFKLTSLFCPHWFQHCQPGLSNSLSGLLAVISLFQNFIKGRFVLVMVLHFLENTIRMVSLEMFEQEKLHVFIRYSFPQPSAAPSPSPGSASPFTKIFNIILRGIGGMSCKTGPRSWKQFAWTSSECAQQVVKEETLISSGGKVSEL